MIDRYSRKEMSAIWTEQNQFQSWLDVELAVCKAWSELGHIPSEDVDLLYKNAGFDINRIKEIEAITRPYVVAFTRAVSEILGGGKTGAHYGLTCSDVVDTATRVSIKQANVTLRKG